MSNQLTETRREIVARLVDAGLNAFDHFPERITTPFAFVCPDDPYVTYGESGQTNFGQEIVNHLVILVTDKGSNEVQTEALDLMICDTLRALEYMADEVEKPGQISVAGIGECYGTSINIPRRVKLT